MKYCVDFNDPKYKDLIKITRLIKKRLKQDKDAVVVVAGEEGIGKSVLAIWLALFMDPKFDLERNVLFDPDLEKLHKCIYQLPKYSAIVVDELVRIGYKRNFATTQNKMLVEMYAICRAENKLSLMCIPRFKMMDSDLRDRTLIWIQVIDRGIAAVFTREKNPFSLDPWQLSVNEKNIRNANRKKKTIEMDNDEYIYSLSHSPNYVDYIYFPDLTQELKNEYLNHKAPFSIRTDKKEVVGTRQKELLLMLGWSFKKMIELGMTQSKISRYICEHPALETNTGFVNSVLERVNARKIDLKAIQLKEVERAISDNERLSLDE